MKRRAEWMVYFSETAASKSAMLLSILKRSFRARENERAIVLRRCQLTESKLQGEAITIAVCHLASIPDPYRRRTC